MECIRVHISLKLHRAGLASQLAGRQLTAYMYYHTVKLDCMKDELAGKLVLLSLHLASITFTTPSYCVYFL